MSFAQYLIRIGTPWTSGPIMRRIWQIPGASLDSDESDMRDALNARFPGRSDPSALSLSGADRRIDRGLFDTDATYAQALREAWDQWAAAGSDFAVGRAVQRYWGPVSHAPDGSPRYVVVEIVSQMGNKWSVLTETGTLQTIRPPVRNWDWDGDDTRRRRFWVIVRGLGLEAIASQPWDVGDGTLVGDGHYVGSMAGAVASDLRRVILKWKADHTYCAGIILVEPLGVETPDALHATNGPADTMPDGTWDDIDSRDNRASYYQGVR